MGPERINSLSPQVTTVGSFSTDPQLVISSTPPEAVKCESDHFCRQCSARWKEPPPPVELETTPIAGKLSFAGKLRHSRKYQVAIGFIACVVVIVVIVLAVVLRPHDPIGLLKGTAGIVALDEGDDSRIVDIFFSHASGQIRHIVWDDINPGFRGGTASNNTLPPSAPSPRKETPLMAVSYRIGNETTWKVYYIDVDDILQELQASTDADDFPIVWLPGSLGLRRYKANSSPNTGLSVCRNMLWSSDPTGSQSGSLVLFYGGGDGLNHMLTHNVQDTAWHKNYTFTDSNATSGIECTVRGASIVDAWMLNSDNRLTQASYEFDTSSTSLKYQPGNWTFGVVFEEKILSPTPISAIKYTGNDTENDIRQNSTFVTFVSGGIVRETNVDTWNRSASPTPPVLPPQSILDTQIASKGGKIASVALRTTGGAQVSYVFLETIDEPKQITPISRYFQSNPNDFEVDDTHISDVGR